MRLISGTLRSTPLPRLPVLSNIKPPALRRKAATNKLVEKIVKHDSWPIQPDILSTPLLRLTSRKPLWLDLQLVDIKSRWRHNCFRTEQGHCVAWRRKWRLTDTDLCPCGETQTMSRLSNPVPWQNWMAAYLGYTLRMKTLFRGWPVMVHDTHTRRRLAFISGSVVLYASYLCLSPIYCLTHVECFRFFMAANIAFVWSRFEASLQLACDLLSTCLQHTHATLQPGLQLARIMKCGLYNIPANSVCMPFTNNRKQHKNSESISHVNCHARWTTVKDKQCSWFSYVTPTNWMKNDDSQPRYIRDITCLITCPTKLSFWLTKAGFGWSTQCPQKAVNHTHGDNFVNS